MCLWFAHIGKNRLWSFEFTYIQVYCVNTINGILTHVKRMPIEPRKRKILIINKLLHWTYKCGVAVFCSQCNLYVIFVVTKIPFLLASKVHATKIWFPQMRQSTQKTKYRRSPTNSDFFLFTLCLQNCGHSWQLVKYWQPNEKNYKNQTFVLGLVIYDESPRFINHI